MHIHPQWPPVAMEKKNESLTRHLSLLSGNVVISIPFSYNKPIDFTKTNCLKRGSNTT